MSETQVPADYGATMQRVVLAEACRAYIAVQDARHTILKGHMKAVEDEVRSAKRLLQRIEASSEPATLQASVGQLLTDRMEHQAALSREYAKAFADVWSAWLTQCQALNVSWPASARPGAASTDPAGVNGLSAAWGSFYDQLGKMSSALAGSMPAAAQPNGRRGPPNAGEGR